jgi:hypothetical protein
MLCPMRGFCHFPAIALRRASARHVAMVAAFTLGCGKDVMVSSWELRLTAEDAGTDAVELDFPRHEVLPDGGQREDREAIEASYEARHDAKKKDENKDRGSDTHSDGESNHP